jgi:hypothetical protein
MAHDDRHFEPGVVTAAVKGAWIGAVSVIAIFSVPILLADASVSLMAVAAVAAIFGGSPFGGLIGASIAASRGPTPLAVQAERPRRRPR